MNYVLLIMLIATGVYDLYLVIKKHPTLSQQYQKLFPTWLDLCFMGLILYTLLAGFPWMDYRIKTVIAMIVGHIFWPNKERYEK